MPDVKCTRSFTNFISEANNSIFIINTAGEVFKTEETLGDTYKKLARTQFDAIAQTWLFAGPCSMGIITYEMARIQLCEIVNNFNCYLAEIIAELFKVNPHFFKLRKHQIRVSEIADYNSKDEIFEHIVWNLVEKLTREKLDNIKEFFKELGIESNFDDTHYKNVKRGIEIRNLFVHNRGIVNQHFKTNTRIPDLIIGEKFELTPEDFDGIYLGTVLCVTSLDSVIVNKFPSLIKE